MSGLQNNPILTPLQRQVLETLFAEPWFFTSFYLTGGTALSAFYLQHRDSDDLDFFTHESFPKNLISSLTNVLSGKGGSVKTVSQTPGFVRLEVDSALKLDFVVDVAARFGVPQEVDGIRVDSEWNIAVNKVCAVLGRLDPKDYVDLLFLIRDRKYAILDLLEKGKQKDAGLELFTWAQLIADCENFSVLPRMRKSLEMDELKSFFQKLRKEIVRSLKP